MLVVSILCAILCGCPQKNDIDKTIVQTETVIEESTAQEETELLMPFETEQADGKEYSDSKSETVLTPKNETTETQPSAVSPPATTPSVTEPSQIKPPSDGGGGYDEAPIDPDQGEII